MTCPHESVSVVIPAHHGATTIARTLESLENQTGVRRLEVIVVESSGDAAADIISRDFPWVTVVREPERMSAGAARNRGASLATGDFILFIDQDCIAPSEWVSKIVADLREPGVDAVGGSIGIADPSNVSGAAVYFLEFMHHFPRRGSLEHDPLFLLGCNAGYRAAVLRNVKFPDRTLGEDVIFTEHIRKAGYGIAYDPELTVLHHNRSGWGEFFAYARKMGRTAAEYNLVLERPAMKPILRWPALVFPAALMVSPWIGWRLLKCNWSYFGLFLLVAPACVLGNLVWAAAFCHQAIHRRSEQCSDPAFQHDR